MSPDKDWMKYLKVAEQQIPQVDEELLKQDSPDVVAQLRDYREILSKIKAQYQPPKISDTSHFIDAAYLQLHRYLDTYLGLLSPENARLFHKDDPKIILYLSDTPSIHRFPKTEHYLLAVQDEDVRSDPPIWSSLAHELGHFVYWNSEFGAPGEMKIAQLTTTLFLEEIWDALGVSRAEMTILSVSDKNETPQSSAEIVAAYVSAWSEEIFADTLAVYLSDEDYFTQSRRFYLDRLDGKKDLRLKEDSDHPFPLLRPYIAAKALQNKTGKSNNLWRQLKDDIRKEHLDQFLKEFEGETNGNIADADMAVDVQDKDKSFDFEVDFEEFKSAITNTIPILAEKIKSSTPVERQTSIPELIEEFKDPHKKNPVPGTAEAIAAIIGKWFHPPPWKKKKKHPPQ